MFKDLKINFSDHPLLNCFKTCLVILVISVPSMRGDFTRHQRANMVWYSTSVIPPLPQIQFSFFNLQSFKLSSSTKKNRRREINLKYLRVCFFRAMFPRNFCIFGRNLINQKFRALRALLSRLLKGASRLYFISFVKIVIRNKIHRGSPC